jgi:UDP-3-O-[3-hydroxymyristoyl] glucosamine N-acyltransferase
MAGVRIGRDAVVRAGATLGAEGFEFRKTSGSVLGVKHSGGVVVGDRVEVQNNSVVEKAVYGGDTRIGDDTKIGGAVLVAHNCQIGKRCLIAGGVTVSGNVVVEDDVWIGPGSVVSNGLLLGAGAHVVIGSVVARSVPAGLSVAGNFAVEQGTFLKMMGALAARQRPGPQAGV